MPIKTTSKVATLDLHNGTYGDRTRAIKDYLESIGYRTVKNLNWGGGNYLASAWKARDLSNKVVYFAILSQHLDFGRGHEKEEITQMHVTPSRNHAAEIYDALPLAWATQHSDRYYFNIKGRRMANRFGIR